MPYPVTKEAHLNIFRSLLTSAKAIELIERAIAESTADEQTSEVLPLDAEIIGQAPAMQEVFRAIGKLSQSNVTVLLTGESGSGKEVVARALHHHSPRAKSGFIALNMAAIPRELMESELFGHERGHLPEPTIFDTADLNKQREELCF